MNSNGSFLSTVLTRVRGFLDEEVLDAKYTDDYLLRHMIVPSMVDVMARLNLGRDEAPVLSFTITIVDEQRDYVLPPCVNQVLRLRGIDEQGNTRFEIFPLGDRNPRGPQWKIEGNLLVFDPLPLTATESLEIQYISNGDFFPCYHTSCGPLTESVTGEGYDTLQLPATFTLGEQDQRENAYAGGVLRLIPTTGKWEERVIEASYYNGTNWFVRVRRPFVATSYTGSFEIAPGGSQPLYHAIATWAAYQLGCTRGMSQKKLDGLLLMHKSAMKSIKDNWSTINAARGTGYDKGTLNNDRFWGLKFS